MHSGRRHVATGWMRLFRSEEDRTLGQLMTQCVRENGATDGHS